MSDFANKIKLYYDRDLWSIERVQKALEMKVITQEEFDEITGVVTPPAEV